MCSLVATGLKRVTVMKDPVKGIGCTIKNAAGHIFVNRIIEDGPIAHTGVLRPGLCIVCASVYVDSDVVWLATCFQYLRTGWGVGYMINLVIQPCYHSL